MHDSVRRSHPARLWARPDGSNDWQPESLDSHATPPPFWLAPIEASIVGGIVFTGQVDVLGLTDIASSRFDRCCRRDTGVEHAMPPMKVSPSGPTKSCVTLGIPNEGRIQPKTPCFTQ